MSTAPFITCHVLDTSIGKPAVGVGIHLQVDNGSGAFETLAISQTNEDGRCKDLQIAVGATRGIYKLIFSVKQYFERLGKESFWPLVEVTFEVAENEHYHVPLLISPFSYTVYRGS